MRAVPDRPDQSRTEQDGQPGGPGGRLVRRRGAWSGAVALAVTGGVLVSASASVPLPGALPGTAAPTVPSGSTSSALDATGTATRAAAVGAAHREVSVDQVLAVLDRAQKMLRRSPSPDIAQAAAELGMLWTTYRAQELVLAEQDAPARATEGIVDRVTFDQVAVAAMRLANMLDPTSPGALIELRADAGSTLRRSLLETVAAHGASTVGYANGRIPADVLCPLEFAPGHLLRCDAAERLTALSAAFEQRFGYPIPLTDSYRSLATQVAVKGTKPHLAAIPGTSNHGWGLAVDLDDPVAGGASAEYVWLRLHGPDYGWDNPSWARLDGAKPEPWHFEFFAAGAVPDRAVDPSDVGTWAPGGAGGAHEESAARPATHVVERPAAQDRPGAGGSGGDGQGAGGTGGDGAGGTGGDGAGGTGGDDGAADAPDTDAPPAPAPAPAEPPAAPPTEPPAEEPDAPAGLVEDVVGGTVGLVTGTVDGVVGGLVGGLLGAGDTAGAPTD